LSSPWLRFCQCPSNLLQCILALFWSRVLKVRDLFVLNTTPHRVDCLGTKDTKSRIISNVVLAVTIVITVAAMWYILRELDRVKPQVIYERRKARYVVVFHFNFLSFDCLSSGKSSWTASLFCPTPLRPRQTSSIPTARLLT
jgi:hypothetical protein